MRFLLYLCVRNFYNINPNHIITMKRFVLCLLMIMPVLAMANPTVTTAETSVATKSEGYYFSVEEYDWLSYEYVSGSDISDLTDEQIDLLRNYIYAKHGYIFKTEFYRRYFSQFRWYRPRYRNVDNMLNKYERKNVLFLRQYTKGR